MRTSTMPGADDAAAIERTYRESSGQAVATLIRLFGDIDLAEEADQGGHRPSRAFPVRPFDGGSVQRRPHQMSLYIWRGAA